MKLNSIIFLDFETGNVNPQNTQPTELSAVAIFPQTLEVDKTRIFSSLMKPEFDIEKCKQKQIAPIEDEALSITNLNKKELQQAPLPNVVWGSFCDWLDNYSNGTSQWSKPHLAGFNIINFDLIILNRLCGHKPYAFGNFDNERKTNTLFHPVHMFDLLPHFVSWLHMKQNIRSVSMSNLRSYLGISSEGEHRAEKDVLDGAEMLVRMLKLYRYFSPKVSFADSFKKDNLK